MLYCPSDQLINFRQMHTRKYIRRSHIGKMAVKSVVKSQTTQESNTQCLNKHFVVQKVHKCEDIAEFLFPGSCCRPATN